MFEILTHLVAQYGLFGLFFSSIIGSTIFVPFVTELLFVPLLELGLNPYMIVVVAALGSMFGSTINYFIGFLGSKYLEKIKKEDVKNAKRISNKYGAVGLFIALVLPLPLPVDALTILAGIGRMNIYLFLAIVFLAKLIKYSAVVGLLSFVGL